MDKLDVKAYRLLKKLYKADKHKKHVMIKHCRERDTLLDKELINCSNSIIQEVLDNLIEQPKFESVEDTFERLKKDRETPVPYYINDKGIEYYYKQHSERLEKIVPLIISYILSAIAIVISVIAIIFK